MADSGLWVNQNEINESEVEKHFENNLKKVNGGVTGETDQIIDGHRFTL